jgi:hypothetical protein
MDNELRGQTACEVAPVFTEKEMADWLRVSVRTLRDQRCKGIGFPYLKLGPGGNASVRYYLPHVLDYIDKCKRVPSVRAAFEMETHATKTR